LNNATLAALLKQTIAADLFPNRRAFAS